MENDICPTCGNSVAMGQYCDRCYEGCPTCKGMGGIGHTACTDCMGTGLIEKYGESKMDTKEAVTLIQLTTGARIVSATYISSLGKNDNMPRVYHFKNVIGLALKKGDVVVVQTNDTMALVKVEEPDVLPTDVSFTLSLLKHVVAKVDTTALDDVLHAERAAVHQLSMSEVTAKLDTFRDQLGGERFAAVQNLLAPTATPMYGRADQRTRNVEPTPPCGGNVGSAIDYDAAFMAADDTSE